MDSTADKKPDLNGNGGAHEAIRAEVNKLVPLEPGLEFNVALTASHARLVESGAAGQGNSKAWLERLVAAERKRVIENNRKQKRSKAKAAQQDGIPHGYRVTESEVQFYEETADGDGNWVIVSSRIDVIAMARDPQSENWGRLLKFKDDDGVEHTWPLPMRLLAGDGTQFREALLDQGVRIASGAKANYRLLDYVKGCRPKLRARSVSTLGWVGNAFVYGDEVLGNPAGEQIVLHTTSPIEHAFKTKGTLPEWQEHVGRPCVGNSRLQMVVSLAFTGALLHIVNAESFGCHLRGGSSGGKTTALQIAGSVNGGGEDPSYVRSWRATANGLESTAALHNDSLLALDEISEITAREAGAAAYMLAHGLGKQRASANGSGRKSIRWRLIFLSSGEISLAQKINEDTHQRAHAGQDIRLLDIPADAGAGLGVFEDLHGYGNGQAFADYLKSQTKKFYGTPLRDFLNQLVNTDHATIAGTCTATRNFFRTKYAADYREVGQILRVAGHLGLVAAAGELAIRMGILPWDKGSAMTAVGECFKAWLAARDGTGPAEIEAGIKQIRKFLEMHGASRFAPIHDKDGGLTDGGAPVVNRAGFRETKTEGVGKDKVDETHFYVLPEGFTQEMCAGFDARVLAKELVERGYLERGDGGRTSVNKKLPGLGQQKVYHLMPKIFDEED